MYDQYTLMELPHTHSSGMSSCLRMVGHVSLWLHSQHPLSARALEVTGRWGQVCRARRRRRRARNTTVLAEAVVGATGAALAACATTSADERLGRAPPAPRPALSAAPTVRRQRSQAH